MTTTYASEYDPLNTATYDPTFTANISNRMQVPDSIHVGGGMDSQSLLHHPDESPRVRMKVPERILLAGDNQHVGLREEFRNMDDEIMKSVPNSHVGLSTPPRVLKIEDSLPNDDETPKRREVEADQRLVVERHVEPVRHERSFLNGLVSMDTSYRSMTPPLPLSAELMADESLMVGQEDDDVAVRRQLTRLQRHVIHLEEENELRSRREMILYPTLLLYFLFQIGKWFVGRK